MNEVCAFAGHSMFVECRLNFEKLKNTIEELIISGVCEFLFETHGEFDKMCLNACLNLKEKYSHIKICRVFSNVSALLREKNNNNVENICYDIENFHFKQRITKTNEFMIDKADVVVFYVDIDITNSGASKTYKYAIKKNKKIINLY